MTRNNNSETSTFAQLEQQLSSVEHTAAVERMDAAALAYRPDDWTTVEELLAAARWYGLITRQLDLLTEFREFEDEQS